MIHFRNVNKVYDTPVLDDINFHIEKGEIFGFIGESGAGKSTILKLVNQLETQTSGSVTVDKVDVSKLSKKDLRTFRQDIGVIFQDYNLLSNRTVYENVSLPLKLRNKENDQDVKRVLDYVGLSGKSNDYPNILSGGEKQRVAIARALVTNPKILLCDEPTSALDEINTQYLLNVLKDINIRLNTTILFVTHQLDVAKSICDRVAILENHKVQDIVKVNKLSKAPFTDYAKMVKEVMEQ